MLPLIWGAVRYSLGAVHTMNDVDTHAHNSAGKGPGRRAEVGAAEAEVQAATGGGVDAWGAVVIDESQCAA